MAKDLSTVITDILKNQASVIVQDVKNRMLNDAREVMDEFYNHYEPNFYYRTHNLRNSFTGNVLRASRANGVFSRTARIEFSTENMKYDTHAIANGSTPYLKDEVMFYSFDEGWHGWSPVWGIDKRKRKKLRPSPAKRMEKRLDKLQSEFESGDWDVRMDEAFNKACDIVSAKLDKEFNKK